jgi:hypothetical protein
MLESEHQKQCIEYASYQYWGNDLICIPNGTELPGNKIQRAIYGRFLAAMGLKPGAADLFLALPSGSMHGAFFELKRAKGPKGGVRNGLTQEQARFLTARFNRGYYVDVCYGFDEWRASVACYLNGAGISPNWGDIFEANHS